LSALPDSVEFAYATATDVPFLEPRWVTRLVELIDGFVVEADDLIVVGHDALIPGFLACFLVESLVQTARQFLLDLIQVGAGLRHTVSGFLDPGGVGRDGEVLDAEGRQKGERDDFALEVHTASGLQPAETTPF